MSDYFERLGNLLNDALESGEIPVEEKKPEEPVVENIKPEPESTQQRPTRNHFRIFNAKNKIPVGQVIKGETIQNNILPPAVIQALNVLNLTYPCSWKTVNKQYHILLKQIHPDTKKSEQQFTTQINDLQNAYQILKQFFGK